MVLLPRAVRVYVATEPVSLRKSFDGLCNEVRCVLGRDPLCGHVFVFINRRQTQLKVLYYDRGGYCVWAKRLEQGQFHPQGQGDKRRLEWTELKLILEGIDLRSIRRFKRYRRPVEVRTSV